MKKVLLFFFFAGAGAQGLRAQFPAFTNYDGSRYYYNKSKSPLIQSYLRLYDLPDSVDSHLADSARQLADQSVTRLAGKDGVIDQLRQHPGTLTLRQLNDTLIKLHDSAAYYRDVSDYYASINKFTGKPRIGASFFPVWRTAQAKFFYQNSPETDSTEKNINFLSSFVVQTNIGKTAISSNLISGAVWIFKASVSTTVVDNNDTTNQAKVNNKLAYGGLLNGQLTWPLFYRVNRLFALYVPLTYGASLDNVTVSNDTLTKKTFYFSELAISAYARIPIVNTNYQPNNACVFFNGKMGYIDGGPSLYDKLGAIRHGFWLCRATAGIEINNKLRIAINFPLYSSEKSIFSNQATTFGIQIDPSLFVSK